MENQQSEKSWYRPEIDGLRALAIIPVILFHAGITGFSGGFVGVDIFFVISGFLITSIIYRELQNGTFSLVRFWERRVRRIVPALLTVSLFTLAAGYFIILFPIDFKSFGASLAAQSLFLANIFFMRQVDYFAAPAETVPLLHTWSLAVEEQFYIVFPILFFLLYRYTKKYLSTSIFILFVLSLTLSMYLTNIAPDKSFTIPFLPHLWGGATNASTAFYFPLARAFELLVGAMLAIGSYTIPKRIVAETAGAAGICLILYSIFFFSIETAFPGWHALFPTIGAALLIISNTQQRTFVGSLLSFPLFVWIGLISYSLYLWHWPVFILGKMYWVSELPSLFYPLALLSIFIAATLTYLFVEQPFRKSSFLKKRRYVLYLLGGLVATCGLGVYVYAKDGLPDRAPEGAIAIAAAATDFNPRREACFKNSFKLTRKDHTPCVLGADNTSVDFVLWGDSHADALMPAFDAVAHDLDITGTFFGAGGCAPLIAPEEISRDENCALIKERAITYIQENDIQLVFLTSPWNETYTSIQTKIKYPFTDLMQYTQTALGKHAKTIIVKQVPHQSVYDTRKLFLQSTHDPIKFTKIGTSRVEVRNTKINTQIDMLTQQAHFQSIDFTDVLCTIDICPIEKNGVILYRDQSHINKTAALLLTPTLQTFLKKHYEQTD